MRNLDCGISAVLASALRHPDRSQYHDFNSALKCVSPLVDFSLMVQYRSHTPDTLPYLERYLQTFYRTKDILLEFHTLKVTCAEGNFPDQDLRELIRNQYANEAIHNTPVKTHRQVDQEILERANQRADLIRHENHFNCIKIHYLSHFVSHVSIFGSISIYYTRIGKLAHK